MRTIVCVLLGALFIILACVEVFSATSSVPAGANAADLPAQASGQVQRVRPN